ncbi:MAG: hypothetical protein KIT80_04365 [Chitinophagaceae bacterium]|nr:hypothetical protein [Chitinophagaceae bacterium]MCW5926124.1 hypothetical protein [Chitinophagaceae bacterium]
MEERIRMKNIVATTVLLLVMTSLFSCLYSSKPVYSYSKTPFYLKDVTDTKLDTTTYYFLEGTGYEVDKGIVDHITILKFFGNGRFLLTGNDTLASIEQQLIPQEKLFYYKIEKGILKMEVYRDPMAGFGYWEGNIYEDSIVFHRVHNTKAKDVFLKKK